MVGITINYPCVTIDLDKIKHNTAHIVNLCRQNHIEVAGVTKVFSANPRIVQTMVEGGIAYIADSRLKNLMKLSHFSLPKILLRLPMLSETKDVVQYADISLNSEIETLKALSKQSLLQKRNHKVILMIDLGDLREGIWNVNEIFTTIEAALPLKGIQIVGIGTNLTCYGGILPDEINLGRLMTYKQRIQDDYGLNLKMISGGNSSSLHLITNHKLPEGINQLRLGESILLGRETAFRTRIPDTYDDIFTLQCEIIELKQKPSIPFGKIGTDAFGEKPVFDNAGIRKRALCGIGRQDIGIRDMIPLDENISILGGSSDHLILDLTNSSIEYKVGSILNFKLTYGGVLRVFTSPYVNKVYKNSTTT